MKKLLIGLVVMSLILICQEGFSAQWDVDGVAGTISPSDLDTYIGYNDTSVDRMLSKYRNGLRLEYASASTITIGIGECMISNSGGTIRGMMANTAAVTGIWGNLDTGSEANSSTYYVYVGTSTISDTTVTAAISLSSTAPSNLTYYIRLGSFYNDSSGNITLIQNDGFFTDMGDWVSRSFETDYQAATDGFAVAYATVATVYIYSDSTSTPTTLRISTSSTSNAGVCCPVKKGDYYKVSSNGTDTAAFWIPID